MARAAKKVPKLCQLSAAPIIFPLLWAVGRHRHAKRENTQRQTFSATRYFNDGTLASLNRLTHSHSIYLPCFCLFHLSIHRNGKGQHSSLLCDMCSRWISTLAWLLCFWQDSFFLSHSLLLSIPLTVLPRWLITNKMDFSRWKTEYFFPFKNSVPNSEPKGSVCSMYEMKQSAIESCVKWIIDFLFFNWMPLAVALFFSSWISFGHRCDTSIFCFWWLAS